MLTFSIKHYKVFDPSKKAAVLFSAYVLNIILFFLNFVKTNFNMEKGIPICREALQSFLL